MSRYAIGDVQGCCAELRSLVARLNFSADRDRLWFVGDLVNRGPCSLEVLRYVRALADNAIVVLGSRERHGLSILVNFTEDTVLHAAPCDVLAVRVGRT